LAGKYLLIGSLGAAIVLGGGLTAFAGTSPGGTSSFVSDLASHLGISTSKLQAGIKATELDQVETLLKAGKITSTQASKLEAAISSGHFNLRPFRLDRPPGRGLIRASLKDVSSAIGIPPQTLIADLKNGETLSEIISKAGKSTSAVEATLQADLKARLDTLVANGRITSQQETTILQNFTSHFQDLLQMTWPWGPRGGGGSAPMGGWNGTSTPNL